MPLVDRQTGIRGLAPNGHRKKAPTTMTTTATYSAASTSFVDRVAHHQAASLKLWKHIREKTVANQLHFKAGLLHCDSTADVVDTELTFKAKSITVVHPVAFLLSILLGLCPVTPFHEALLQQDIVLNTRMSSWP